MEKPNPADIISGQVIIATAMSFILAISAVVLRFWSRRIQEIKLRTDDYLILAALIVKYGLSITGIILLCYGFGTHVDFVSPENITTFLQVLYSGPIIYAITITLVKLSVLFLYHRIFSFFYVRIWGFVIGLSAIFWCIAVSLAGIVNCTPIRKSWEPGVSGHCINLLSFYYGLQIPNILTDIAILVLPLPAIWALPVNISSRLILFGLFTVGILTVAFDVVRLVIFLKLKTTDITYSTIPGFV